MCYEIKTLGGIVADLLLDDHSTVVDKTCVIMVTRVQLNADSFVKHYPSFQSSTVVDGNYTVSLEG